jgi:hypothetical protein
LPPWVETSAELDIEESRAVLADNALKLFPRLAAGTRTAEWGGAAVAAFDPERICVLFFDPERICVLFDDLIAHAAVMRNE